MLPTSMMATCGVIVASIGFGLVPYFAKNLIQTGVAPAAVSFYRYALTAIVLLPFLALSRGKRLPTCWGIAAGVIMGIGSIGYLQALKFVPVSTVGVLYMTYPLFTVVIAWCWLGVRPGYRSITAATLILIAAVVAMSPASVAAHQLGALLISLVAPLSFGFAINTLTDKLNVLAAVERMACVSLGSVIGLLPVLLTLEVSSILPASARGWWLIAGIALLTALLPQLIYTVNAPRIGAAKSAMAGSIELPTMFAVGWLTFGESITQAQALAGILVLAAIVITPTRRAANIATQMATHGDDEEHDFNHKHSGQRPPEKGPRRIGEMKYHP